MRRGRRSFGALVLGSFVAATVLAGCSSDDPTATDAADAAVSGPAAPDGSGASGGASAPSDPRDPDGSTAGEDAAGDAAPSAPASGAGATNTGVPPEPDLPAPGMATTPATQDAVLDSLPGSAATACATVGSQRDVRAGSMGAGNFVDARAAYRRDPGYGSSIPLYFIPRDVGDSPKVTVTVARPDGSDSTTFVSTELSRFDLWQYYVMRVSVPSDGAWRISAVAGKNKGCFETDFGA